MRDTNLPEFHSPSQILSAAVKEYISSNQEQTIKVWMNNTKEPSYKASFFMRNYKEMPEYEQVAMSLASGKILDIGAGAGPHSEHLNKKGLNVTSLEADSGFCDLLKRISGLQVIQDDFFHWKPSEKYDTILLLMNGLGIASTKERLYTMFEKLKSLMSENGKIIVEITDYKCSPEYNSKTMKNPEVNFRLLYNSAFSEEFKWIYPDL